MIFSWRVGRLVAVGMGECSVARWSVAIAMQQLQGAATTSQEARLCMLPILPTET
jgi:hypothetical protein